MKDGQLSGLLPESLPRVSAKRLLNERVGKCAAMLTYGFLLSGATLLHQPLPLAAALVAALPFGAPQLFAVGGALLGYLLRCDAAQAVQYSALTLLMLAAAVVFYGTGLPAREWFMPVMASAVNALLGGVFLFGAGVASIGLWVATSLLSGIGTLGFRAALRGDKTARLLLLAALLSGISAFAKPIDFGLCAACALSITMRGLLPTAVAAISLDLTGSYAGFATVALLLPAILCGTMRKKSLLYASFFLLPNVVFFAIGQLTLGRFIGICAGTLLGVFLRRIPYLRNFFATELHDAATIRLSKAAAVLEQISNRLPKVSNAASQGEAESVYDGAAERVCRCCARFHRCWQNRAEDTYRTLTSVAKSIIERGTARCEDFPPDFRDRCCHMEGFVTAINQELEGMLYRRRYRMQVLECRQAVTAQLECMAQYLRLAADVPDSPDAYCPYLPAIGVASAAKQGNRTDGDRGACFAGCGANYYVLLCDGMGSGEGAASLSNQTIRFLSQLLKSGVEPEQAMRLLNSIEVLEGTGCFATVDLLHIDLNTGNAVLNKWGAAPSYYRQKERVKKIGTATPPPGVGVGGEHLPEQYQLSLKWGELLVMVSDGAGCSETEETIAAYCGQSPRELAAMLIAGCGTEDDRTAVCISLRSRSS